MPRPIDVKAAIANIQSFGYEAGYLQTATFMVTKPVPPPEIVSIVAVRVEELEELGQCADLAAFEATFHRIRTSPAPNVIRRVGT
jgi:hypothetical protein